MPLTIRSGGRSSRPSAAKRTQSTGVPSVASAAEPSASATSSTWSGLWIVIPRPMALRFESGAMTLTSPTCAQRLREGEEAGRMDAVVVGDEDVRHGGPA